MKLNILYDPRTVVVVLMTLTLSSCGGSFPQSTRPSSPPEESVTSAPITRTDPSSAVRVLPAGVAAQLEFFIGGGGSCPLHNYTPPPVPAIITTKYDSPFDYTLEVPGSIKLCFSGFLGGENSAPIDVDITSPDGARVMKSSLDVSAYPPGPIIDDYQSIELVRSIGDMKGSYEVRAEQDGISIAVDVQVVHASSPGMLPTGRLVDESALRDTFVGKFPTFEASEELSVEFGGFLSNSLVPLRIYGPLVSSQENYKVNYYSTVDAHSTNEGEGIFHYIISESMPEGCYRFYNEQLPDTAYIAEFCVSS